MASKKWETLFTKKTLEEGKEFYVTGKAKKLTEEYDGYSAKVRDDRNYDVKIETDYSEDEGTYITGMSCTCSKGTLCSHCAAVLYMISDELEIAANITVNGKTYGMVKKSAAELRKEKEETAQKEAAQKAEEKAKAEEKTEEKTKEPVKMLPSLSGITALQKQENNERTKAAKEDKSLDVYHPDDYRYFHYENFEKGLNMPAARVRSAKAIRKQIQSMQVHLLQQKSEKGRDAIIGECICYFESAYDTVSIRFNQNRLISVRCSKWSCYMRTDSKSYGGIYMCEHAIAALDALKDYLQHNNIGDITNNAGYALLNEVLAENNSLSQGDKLSHEAISIEPVPEINDNRMYVSFRTGTTKLYKIRNLREFYDNMQQERDMKFGTKTIIHMGKAYLDEKSEKWYEFISQVLDEEDERRSRTEAYYYDPSGETKTEIDLYGDRLDQCISLMMGDTVEFTIRDYADKIKEKLLVQEKDPDISLEIHKDVDPGTGIFNGVVLSGTVPEIIQGRKNAYYVEPGEFDRISEDTYDKLQLFLKNAADGKISISIGRRKLSDFYHKVLPVLKKSVNVTEYDTDTVAKYLPPDPVFTIYLDTENDTVIGRIDVAYGMQVLSGTDLLDEKEGSRAFEQYRDRKKESQVLGSVTQYLTNYDPRGKVLFSYKNDEVVFDLLNEGLDEFLDFADVRMTDRFKRLGLKRHVKFRVGVSIDSGLLDLSVTAEELSEEEMLDVLYQYQKKRKFVKLKNGDFLKIQGNEAVEQLAQMMEALHLNVKDFTKGKMHIPAYRALYLEKMLEDTEDIYADRDRHFRKLIKEFKTVQDADYEVPENLKNVMRKYQREGYEWLRTLDRYGFGGILADEMGLGKTLQTIACILAVKNEREEGIAQEDAAGKANAKEAEPVTSLVVCPASLVFNWGEEFAKFAPSLKIELVTGTQEERAQIIKGSSDADVLVTSYDLLKRDVREYEGLKFRFEVIDEAQYIKNQATAAAKSVKIINAKTKFALTGTPIENRLSELWSIFDYLMPGFLYDYSEFRSSVELPIVKFEDEDAQARLKKMVAPFILRRKKEDVLKDLPEKLEEVRYAGLSGKQQKLYDAEVMRMKDTIKNQNDADFRKSKIQILAELMKIRQICCDPLLCYSDYDGESAKKEVCMELVESLVDGGHKALIFSQFTSMLELLKTELDKEDIAYYEITGATPKEKRLEMVNAFNSDDTPIFLISLKAGGTGLNLTGADVVIHYDPWWNTAAQDQATDRAHRIGQTKVVTVYKLIMKGTIEEKIMEMQEKKKQLADEILSGENIASSTITREDLLAMLD